MEMMHGNDWTGEDVAGWFASEKLDGWRIRWDGSHMLTRSGMVIHAPDSFTKNLPSFELDCELHLGRGFNHCDTHKAISANDWTRLKLTAFDVPSQREDCARGILATLHMTVVTFIKVESSAHALSLRDAVIRRGGEGIMLRKPDSDYLPYRCDVLLKMK